MNKPRTAGVLSESLRPTIFVIPLKEVTQEAERERMEGRMGWTNVYERL